jgi:hypothetical protein
MNKINPFDKFRSEEADNLIHSMLQDEITQPRSPTGSVFDLITADSKCDRILMARDMATRIANNKTRRRDAIMAMRPNIQDAQNVLGCDPGFEIVPLVRPVNNPCMIRNPIDNHDISHDKKDDTIINLGIPTFMDTSDPSMLLMYVLESLDENGLYDAINHTVLTYIFNVCPASRIAERPYCSIWVNTPKDSLKFCSTECQAMTDRLDIMSGGDISKERELIDDPGIGLNMDETDLPILERKRGSAGSHLWGGTMMYAHSNTPIINPLDKHDDDCAYSSYRSAPCDCYQKNMQAKYNSTRIGRWT